MGFHSTLLFLHITSACVWFGAYVVKSFIQIPKAKKSGDYSEFIEFEHAFSRFGIPSLLLQLITGPILATRYYPNPLDWFAFQNGTQDHIASKLVFRLQRRVLPVLASNDEKAAKSARRITHWITFFAFCNVMMGVSVNTGGFSY